MEEKLLQILEYPKVADRKVGGRNSGQFSTLHSRIIKKIVHDIEKEEEKVLISLTLTTILKLLICLPTILTCIHMFF